MGRERDRCYALRSELVCAYSQRKKFDYFEKTSLYVESNKFYRPGGEQARWEHHCQVGRNRADSGPLRSTLILFIPLNIEDGPELGSVGVITEDAEGGIEGKGTETILHLGYSPLISERSIRDLW